MDISSYGTQLNGSELCCWTSELHAAKVMEVSASIPPSLQKEAFGFQTQHTTDHVHF